MDRSNKTGTLLAARRAGWPYQAIRGRAPKKTGTRLAVGCEPPHMRKNANNPPRTKIRSKWWERSIDRERGR
jgi:hypothetical protein